MTKILRRFVIVDDVPLNNLLSKLVLIKSLGEVEIHEFVDAKLALVHIETELEHKHLEARTTLLLDINMPSLTGWEFLEKFETFHELIKEHYNIYMLSSSVDPIDIQRAKVNPRVIDFIEKPLRKDTILKMFY